MFVVLLGVALGSLADDESLKLLYGRKDVIRNQLIESSYKFNEKVFSSLSEQISFNNQIITILKDEISFLRKDLNDCKAGKLGGKGNSLK